MRSISKNRLAARRVELRIAAERVGLKLMMRPPERLTQSPREQVVAPAQILTNENYHCQL